MLATALQIVAEQINETPLLVRQKNDGNATECCALSSPKNCMSNN